ncbi:hypothetical protein PPERSA_12247 [Pseudocohnilembus persalinus]|uniref:Uncharacterized protein n=1 Tax=Pseudocohnilembus persalinus TaxID=266149 RepID=A0A0V0R569_PSEPJ|nr:hypothetical protein PPERSA_12247 [Pseudocohnilembus persalinus]|eukprot:KRX09504.1 hypothetical protein PPERSA_12247 [Pseudocohnilembus persalinus]
MQGQKIRKVLQDSILCQFIEKWIKVAQINKEMQIQEEVLKAFKLKQQEQQENQEKLQLQQQKQIQIDEDQNSMNTEQFNNQESQDMVPNLLQHQFSNQERENNFTPNCKKQSTQINDLNMVDFQNQKYSTFKESEDQKKNSSSQQLQSQNNNNLELDNRNSFYFIQQQRKQYDTNNYDNENLNNNDIKQYIEGILGNMIKDFCYLWKQKAQQNYIQDNFMLETLLIRANYLEILQDFYIIRPVIVLKLEKTKQQDLKRIVYPNKKEQSEQSQLKKKNLNEYLELELQTEMEGYSQYSENFIKWKFEEGIYNGHQIKVEQYNEDDILVVELRDSINLDNNLIGKTKISLKQLGLNKNGNILNLSIPISQQQIMESQNQMENLFCFENFSDFSTKLELNSQFQETNENNQQENIKQQKKLQQQQMQKILMQKQQEFNNLKEGLKQEKIQVMIEIEGTFLIDDKNQKNLQQQQNQNIINQQLNFQQDKFVKNEELQNQEFQNNIINQKNQLNNNNQKNQNISNESQQFQERDNNDRIQNTFKKTNFIQKKFTEHIAVDNYFIEPVYQEKIQMLDFDIEKLKLVQNQLEKLKIRDKLDNIGLNTKINPQLEIKKIKQQLALYLMRKSQIQAEIEGNNLDYIVQIEEIIAEQYEELEQILENEVNNSSQNSQQDQIFIQLHQMQKQNQQNEVFNLKKVFSTRFLWRSKCKSAFENLQIVSQKGFPSVLRYNLWQMVGNTDILQLMAKNFIEKFELIQKYELSQQQHQQSQIDKEYWEQNLEQNLLDDRQNQHSENQEEENTDNNEDFQAQGDKEMSQFLYEKLLNGFSQKRGEFQVLEQQFIDDLQEFRENYFDIFGTKIEINRYKNILCAFIYWNALNSFPVSSGHKNEIQLIYHKSQIDIVNKLWILAIKSCSKISEINSRKLLDITSSQHFSDNFLNQENQYQKSNNISFQQESQQFSQQSMEDVFKQIENEVFWLFLSIFINIQKPYFTFINSFNIQNDFQHTFNSTHVSNINTQNQNFLTQPNNNFNIQTNPNFNGKLVGQNLPLKSTLQIGIKMDMLMLKIAELSENIDILFYGINEEDSQQKDLIKVGKIYLKDFPVNQLVKCHLDLQDVQTNIILNNYSVSDHISLAKVVEVVQFLYQTLSVYIPQQQIQEQVEYTYRGNINRVLQ